MHPSTSTLNPPKHVHLDLAETIATVLIAGADGPLLHKYADLWDRVEGIKGISPRKMRGSLVAKFASESFGRPSRRDTRPFLGRCFELAADYGKLALYGIHVSRSLTEVPDACKDLCTKSSPGGSMPGRASQSVIAPLRQDVAPR